MELFLTPLLQFIGVGASALTIAFSCILAWMFPLPFFMIAGRQDKRTHEIDGLVLLVIGILTLMRGILFINLATLLLTGPVLYLTFREKEIPLMGQADFILLEHWILSSFCFGSGELLMVVESVIFLVCLLVYTKTYRDENGKKWKRGKMVPLFPPYVVTVCIMAVVSIPFGILAYNWGF